MKSGQIQGDRCHMCIRKTSEICAQCRNRKVACDGDPQGCGNCKRLSFACSLLASSSDGIGFEVLERRRVSRACIRCRDRKLKCSGRRPTCSRCLDRGVVCDYPPHIGADTSGSNLLPQYETSNVSQPTFSAQNSGFLEAASPQAHVQNDTQLRSGSVPMSHHSSPWDLGIDNSTIRKHIDAYFDLIHPIPCYGFLHRATLLQSWSKKELNSCVLLAICGITSRFINPGSSEHRNMATNWIERAESQLLEQIAQPRTSDVEAWLLVTLDHYLSQRVSQMLVSMALASRLAYILRLNHEDPRQSFLVRERRRRLMWSIYVMDSLYSSGMAEFTACSSDILHIRLPCNENSFSMNISVTTDPLHSTSQTNTTTVGLLGYCIRVLDIRNRVQRLTLSITNHRKPIEECLPAVEFIENELHQFSASLPARYHLDPTAFSLRAFSPARTPFLMLHVWWHQAYCDLFRFTIPGFREGLPIPEILQMSPQFAASCREKCLFHAVSVSEILEIPQAVGGSELISDPSIAKCAFHSARVISRLGQPPMGNMPQMDLVARLTACSEALNQQALLYPTTAILKRGINDLTNDAQRVRHGPYACPSIWEEEECESTETTAVSRLSEGESESREVFSKHSVTDAVRSLHLQPEAQNNRPGSQNPSVQTAFGVSSGITMTPDLTRPVAAESSLTQASNSTLSDSVGADNAALGPYFAEAEVPEETLYDIGLNGQYTSGQPDVFMDAFWTFVEGDWTAPNIVNR